MPLVFGCAPVVNAFLTIYWAGSWKEVSPMFLAGLILVAVGAFTVLFFAPKSHAGPSAAAHAAVESAEAQLSGRYAKHGTRWAASCIDVPLSEQPGHSASFSLSFASGLLG